MPLTTQQMAVSGRKLPRRNVDVINAMTPYLPAIYQQREAGEHADRMYELAQEEHGFAEEQLVANKESALIEQELARQGLRQQKKQAEKAELMGWIGLGTGAGLGIADMMGGDDIIDMTPSADGEIFEAIKESGITSPLLREGAKTALEPSGLSSLISETPVVGDIYDVGSDVVGAIVPDFIKNLGSSIYEGIGNIFDGFDLFS